MMIIMMWLNFYCWFVCWIVAEEKYRVEHCVWIQFVFCEIQWIRFINVKKKITWNKGWVQEWDLSFWFSWTYEVGVRLPTWRGNWKWSHTLSSHPMQCTCTCACMYRCRCTYRVTLRVFSSGTLQQQLSWTMSLCSDKCSSINSAIWPPA